MIEMCWSVCPAKDNFPSRFENTIVGIVDWYSVLTVQAKQCNWLLQKSLPESVKSVMMIFLWFSEISNSHYFFMICLLSKIYKLMYSEILIFPLCHSGWILIQSTIHMMDNRFFEFLYWDCCPHQISNALFVRPPWVNWTHSSGNSVV